MGHVTSRSAVRENRRHHRYPRLARYVVVSLALIISLGATPPAAPRAGAATLIYCGWYGNTIPTPSFIKTNKVFLDSQPFDGTVVYLRDAGLTVNVTTKTMTNTPLSYETIAWVLSPLSGLSFTNMKYNMGLIQGSSPPDFFDDWSIPIQNFANVAKAARDIGLKGICFDNEQYAAPWGNYGSSSKYAATKSLAEYQAQARLRGKQVMEAMTAHFPDIAVLTLHGPYVSEPDAPASLQFPQWQSGNELLGPYFAGFLEGAGDTASSIDGGEIYTLRTAEHFQASYTWRRTDLASDAVDCAFIPPSLRTVWDARTSISFGMYDVSFGGAAMTPTIMRSALANALRRADHIVWYYAEAYTYLLPSAAGGAPATWVDAVRNARIDAGAASASTTTTEPLGTPSNLSGQSPSSTEIRLTWSDQSSAETGFSIQRLDGTAWSPVGSVGSNVTTWTDTGLVADTSYSYRVAALDGSQSSPTSNVITVRTPASSGIPAAPSNLTVSSVTASSVALSWSDGSINENGFSIERLVGTTWTQIGWVGTNLATYSDAGLGAGTYSYRIKAFNGYGNSAPSNVATATTSSGASIPAAPSNLVASGVTSSSVTLSWTDGSANENGFSIERLSGSTWTQTGWVAANVTTFVQSGLTAGTTYSYRVLAFNGYGNSATTNVVTATPSGTKPQAPSNLTAAAASATAVELSWTDRSGNESGFRVYRKRAGGSWTLVGTASMDATSFQDAGGRQGATYVYRVRAFNAAGSSSFSNEARITLAP